MYQTAMQLFNLRSELNFKNYEPHLLGLSVAYQIVLNLKIHFMDE